VAQIDYSTVTEVTGSKVSAEQLQRMYTRYRFASEFCEGKEVLEVACGSGQGLGYLAKKARTVIGGDYDKNILRYAKEHYGGRISVRQLDAHSLPFADRSFDVVILYEAIYYLAEPEKFIKEAYRVLRGNGMLLVCTANKDRSGFNPSPYTYRYFSANELFKLLSQNGFSPVELYGDCPADEDSIKGKIVSVIKKAAVNLHIIPKTMKGKEFFKRIFLGKLIPLPPEITDGMADYTRPVHISHDAPNFEYKVIYAVATV